MILDASPAPPCLENRPPPRSATTGIQRLATRLLSLGRRPRPSATSMNDRLLGPCGRQPDKRIQPENQLFAATAKPREETIRLPRPPPLKCLAENATRSTCALAKTAKNRAAYAYLRPRLLFVRRARNFFMPATIIVSSIGMAYFECNENASSVVSIHRDRDTPIRCIKIGSATQNDGKCHGK